MNPNRAPQQPPPTPTSWAQMSAAGAANAASATPLSFISTSSSSSSSLAATTPEPGPTSGSASSSRPTYNFGATATPKSGLASVLSASPAHLSAANTSSSSTSSSSSSAASGGQTSSGPSSLQASSGPSSMGDSLHSSAMGQQHTYRGQMVPPSSPMSPLQFAMGEVNLAGNFEHHFGSSTGQQHDLSAVAGEELLQAQQREADRKLRLQLYVFVLRCISYPFNAKQTATGDHRQQMVKLRKNQLEQVVLAHSNFIKAANAFLPGKCAHSNLSSQLTVDQLKQLDELYEQAHLTFNRRFLQNERMQMLVDAECCCQQDLRDLFKQNAERVLKESQLIINARFQQQQLNKHRSSASYQQHQQLRSGGTYGTDNRTGAAHYQEPAGLSACSQLLACRDAILNAWQIKFESIIREDPNASTSGDSALGDNQHHQGLAMTTAAAAAAAAAANVMQPLTKEQLYQMFQNILTVKKFEHQLLYNALQLDSSDEQAAAIRRELDGRVARIAELERNKKLLPKFVLKEMEHLFVEEARMAVNKLMVNLDSLPVMKGDDVGGNNLIGGGTLIGSGTGGTSGGLGAPASESRVYSGLQKFRRYNSR